MRIHWARLVAIVGLAAASWACSDEPPPQPESPVGLDPPPVGTWIMFGGARGALKAETFDTEETELVLADSTYSLTFKRPNIHFVFVETGKVYYDLRGKVARFTVATNSGVDWSSGVPRKLALIPESVPFQRDPGTMYGLEYNVQDSLLHLAGSGMEASYFVRAPH